MMIILMIIIIVIIMISIIIVVVVVIIVAITEIIPIIAVVTIINSPFQPGDFPLYPPLSVILASSKLSYIQSHGILGTRGIFKTLQASTMECFLQLFS